MELDRAGFVFQKTRTGVSGCAVVFAQLKPNGRVTLVSWIAVGSFVPEQFAGFYARNCRAKKKK